MASASCTEEKFIELFKKLQSPILVAQELGISERNVHVRRRAIEARRGISLEVKSREVLPPQRIAKFYDKPIDIAVFTDPHFWPDSLSPAYNIFKEAVGTYAPDVVLCTGDILDAARISRHPRRGWETRPSLKQELEAAQHAMSQIYDVSRNAEHLLTKANHDDRFDNYLSANASEFEGLPGTRLYDYFPGWEVSDLITFNNTLAAFHDWHSGIHGAFNNTLKAGISTVSGHTHRCTVREWTDFTGTRYGIEAGTLAQIYDPQFAYTKMRPVNWQSGFAWIHIDGDEVYPERVVVNDRGTTRWRGKTWKG